ncbi:hypothetical protein ACOMHN_016648 [Nucella lapillus]
MMECAKDLPRDPRDVSEQEDYVGVPHSAGDSVPACLREGDHSTDLVFTVEGQRLHFSKAVLTMCSPVFQSLLTPDFVQLHSEGIPLEGKTYRAVVFFLTQLHPVLSAVTPMTESGSGPQDASSQPMEATSAAAAVVPVLDRLVSELSELKIEVTKLKQRLNAGSRDQQGG